jgi:hypothetical protein
MIEDEQKAATILVSPTRLSNYFEIVPGGTASDF